jgi:HAD superfamily hydrolase (TIGR01509 family)
MIDAVVFDFDGVVLDSETPEFESHRRIYEQCGVTLTPDEWCRKIGIYAEEHEDAWFVLLCERAARPPARHEYESEKRRWFSALVPREPMAGIRALIESVRGAGIATAIASTAPSGWVVPAAGRIGVAHLFDAIVTADDVRRRKPAPDVYLEAARRLGADPRQCIAIEDSAPGIASARAAGMKTVAIPHWLTERHDLSAADLRVSRADELTIERLTALCSRSDIQ